MEKLTNTLEKLNEALSLDLLLLKLESSLGMMDGMPLSIDGIPLEKGAAANEPILD